MDPLSLMSSTASLIGMGVQAFGMSQARTAANNVASDQTQILMGEQTENQLRQQAMNLSAQRQQIQNVRNTQRARAMGMSAAVNQGAQFGSGVAGGQSAASAEGAWNAEGISRNQQIGNQIFSTDNSIDQFKLQMGMNETSLNNAQGLMSMGQGIAQSGQALGRIGMQGFGFFSNLFGNQGSGSQAPSGYNGNQIGGLY